MINATAAVMDFFPGEEFLTESLQNQLCLTLDGKVVKKGRLLHFRKQHFVIVLTFLTAKGNTENTEVPLPFFIERHVENDKPLIYFDYRLKRILTDGVSNNNFVKLSSSLQPSNYFNKILEITSV